MIGQIALVGGDEFRKGCEEMDRAILGATGQKNPSVLIVPTAAARQHSSKAASNGVAYFSDLGADASALMVIETRDANDDDLLQPVDAADMVYLTGGDPAHLLDALSGSALLRKINAALERGAIVAGSSAGAMVMGLRMRFKEWRKALGLVSVVTFPHHERSDPDRVAAELARAAPEGLTVLGIDAMTACFRGPDAWSALGAGRVTVYRDGHWQQFESGETVELD